MVNFVQHQEFATRFPDTVAPFQAFGNTCKDHFPATLFRFPLRTEAQAAASRISNEVIPMAQTSMPASVDLCLEAATRFW